jgi:hypothetical protein
VASLQNIDANYNAESGLGSSLGLLMKTMKTIRGTSDLVLEA